MKRAILATALTVPFAFAQAAQAEQPNVVFILVDDLGYTDLNFVGQKALNTPNVDQLREDGMYFDNAYAACPVSSPTRASIMTGEYPAEVKITCHIPGVGMDEYLTKMSVGHKMKETSFVDHLTSGQTTIASVMKAKGYKTAFMGKWHLAGSGSVRDRSTEGRVSPEFHPENYGFDINLAGCSYGQPASYFSPYRNAQIEDGPSGEFLTDRLGDEAVKFIEANKSNPFLLYLSFYAVHTPLQAPEKTIEENNGDKYFALIQKMDENVGKVLSSLKAQGLDENTLVIFYSDNGGLQDNSPLSGRKGELREGGIRVPLICKWAGRIEAGSTNHTPVTSVDFMATLQDLTKTKVKNRSGESLLPILLGKKKDLGERAIFWHFPHHREKSEWSMGAAVRKGDWKLIQLYEKGEVKLFNLREDLQETQDLSVTHPEKTKELLDDLLLWQKSIDATMPEEN